MALSPELKILRKQLINDAIKLIDRKLYLYQNQKNLTNQKNRNTSSSEDEQFDKTVLLNSNGLGNVSTPDFNSLESASESPSIIKTKPIIIEPKKEPISKKEYYKKVRNSRENSPKYICKILIDASSPPDLCPLDELPAKSVENPVEKPVEKQIEKPVEKQIQKSIVVQNENKPNKFNFKLFLNRFEEQVQNINNIFKVI